MMVRPLFFLPPRFDLEDGPEVVVNSKDSTTFWGRLQRALFPSNLDRREGTCLESAVDLLIPRPS
jgi:hypothetical protein